MMDQLTVDEWRERLANPLGEALGDPLAGRLSLLCPPKPVQDDPMKLLVQDVRGRRVAVVLCASPMSPGLVARGMQRARQVKCTLTPELGRVILDPLGEGDVCGLTYAILPYCQPLSNWRLVRRAQRFALRSRLFRWLYLVAERTVTRPTADELTRDFTGPLKHLVEFEGMAKSVCTAASEALERLRAGEWLPRYVVMHNDLQDSNVLIDPRTPSDSVRRAWAERFVIIDWPGALVKGYAMFDLIRLAQSMSLDGWRLRDEISAHCRVLGCELIDARCHLLAALGYLGMHLEYFPVVRYARMVHSCLDILGGHVR